MSVSLWRWTEECDKQVCVGDCDLCRYVSGDKWEIDPREIEENYIFLWKDVKDVN